MPTNDYYSFYSPVIRMYLYSFIHKMQFVQRDKFIYTKIGKGIPQPEFVIEKTYIRGSMI